MRGKPGGFASAAAAGRPDRLGVYDHSLTLLRDAPFSGIGSGDQFARVLSKYALLIQVPFLTYSHNLSLDVWLEYGLLGFAAWWALAAAIAVAAVAGERAALGWRFRGLWLGLLAIHAHGLTDARQSVDVWTWLPFFAIAGAFAAHVSRHRLRVSLGWACAPLGVAGHRGWSCGGGAWVTRGRVGGQSRCRRAGASRPRSRRRLDARGAPSDGAGPLRARARRGCLRCAGAPTIGDRGTRCRSPRGGCAATEKGLAHRAVEPGDAQGVRAGSDVDRRTRHRRHAADRRSWHDERAQRVESLEGIARRNRSGDRGRSRLAGPRPEPGGGDGDIGRPGTQSPCRRRRSQDARNPACRDVRRRASRTRRPVGRGPASRRRAARP